MTGHGHVVPNPDGSKARCGGPALCSVCAKELAALQQSKPDESHQEARAMRMRYAGPGPHDDEGLGLVRPGDEYDFTEPPDWGPWEPIEDGAERPAAASGTPAPAAGAESPAPAATASAGADSTDPSTAGM